MARFSAGCLTTAGSTSLPIISIYASASGYARIREIGLFNTTNTAVALVLKRLTTAGTRGTALTNAQHDPDSAAPIAACYNTHTVGPTITDDLGYRCVLGAAAGSGIVWTFGADGLEVTKVANAGVGVLVENGTGQAVQAYICWDE